MGTVTSQMCLLWLFWRGPDFPISARDSLRTPTSFPRKKKTRGEGRLCSGVANRVGIIYFSEGADVHRLFPRSR